MLHDEVIVDINGSVEAARRRQLHARARLAQLPVEGAKLRHACSGQQVVVVWIGEQAQQRRL